jgi:hypothetical protein
VVTCARDVIELSRSYHKPGKHKWSCSRSRPFHSTPCQIVRFRPLVKLLYWPFCRPVIRTKPTSDLHLSGEEGYARERSHHDEILSWQSLSEEARKLASVHQVDFTVGRTKHGVVPIRIFFAPSEDSKRSRGEFAALVYMHGGQCFRTSVYYFGGDALNRRLYCWLCRRL